MFVRFVTSVLFAIRSSHSPISFESTWRFMGQSRLNDNYSAGKLFFVNLTLYINQRQVLPVMVLLPGLTPGSRIQVLNQI